MITIIPGYNQRQTRDQVHSLEESFLHKISDCISRSVVIPWHGRVSCSVIVTRDIHIVWENDTEKFTLLLSLDDYMLADR